MTRAELYMSDEGKTLVNGSCGHMREYGIGRYVWEAKVRARADETKTRTRRQRGRKEARKEGQELGAKTKEGKQRRRRKGAEQK